MPYTIHIPNKGNQMEINFATATAEQLAAAGYKVSHVAPKKAPTRSAFGTKSAKGGKQDKSAWARF